MLKFARESWGFAVLLFCMVAWEGQAMGQVKGTATYHERMALPPDAVFEATLENVSKADAPAKVIGHAHSDHAGAHAYLQNLSGAKVAVIREEKDLIESGGKLDFHYRKYKEFEFEPVKVDWVFQDGDILKRGDIAITALLTNGHTKVAKRGGDCLHLPGVLFRVGGGEKSIA